MSLSQALRSPSRAGTRWLLFGSLALNLFFIGVAVAIAIRPPPPPRWHRNVFVRVERLAASLPQADAALLRDAMQANRAAIEAAQDKYYAGREAIRETLRQEPFKVEDMRAAMAGTRAARQAYDQVLQDVFADTAAKMSPEGRHGLADWRAGRRKARDRR